MKDKKLVPKAYRRLAEVAAEHYCYEVLGCVRTVRAVANRFQRQDLFASDVLGRKPDGTLCAIQVTSGQSSAVSTRKRKLEKEIWHSSDTVLLLQLYWDQSPKNKRSKLWYFKVWRYMHDLGKKEWKQFPSESVPQEWFKLYKKEIE
jgi:hypothetical protein